MILNALILLSVPCSIALAVIGIVGIVRVVRTAREVPSLRAGIAMADRQASTERVCAIVPAHNEEGSIAAVLESLRTQRGVDLRVVVALDRCTDRTRERALGASAGDPRFEIIEVGACPEGWTGKVNALWQAAQTCEAARAADVLLFLDADVTMEPDCTRASLALRRERALDMVTLLSTLRHRHWFERLVQPACVMELSYEFPLIRANRRRNRRPFVNGQFVLVARGAYDRFGGHAAVAGDIMEDLALARVAADEELAVGVFPADGLLVANMYETWSAFLLGWTRIFVGGAGQKVSRLEKWATRLAIFCAALPVVVAGAGVLALLAQPAWGWARVLALVSAAAGTGMWGGVVAWAYARQKAPLWSVLVNPIGFVFTAWILRRASVGLAARRPIAWAGRTYVVEPR